MEILVRDEQGFTVVSVSGRLDAGTAQELETSCANLIEKGGRKLIFNLSALEYVSSAGLRSVLAVAKKLKAVGSNLALCGLSGLVQEVFTISGFDSFLPVHDTVESAVEKG
jgi:anti-anti-sigma factor